MKVTVTSSDEAIFTVESSIDGLVTLRTLKAGDAELVLKQDGDVVDSRPIKVKYPARIAFSLELKADEPDDIVPALVDVPLPVRLMAGRNARLAAHVFAADDNELFGHCVAGIAPVDTSWAAGLIFDGPSSFIELAPRHRRRRHPRADQCWGPVERRRRSPRRPSSHFRADHCA